MAAFLVCDKCECEIHDGVEILMDFIVQPKGSRRETEDYCSDCAENGMMYNVNRPMFVKMLVTKVGIHHEYDR